MSISQTFALYDHPAQMEPLLPAEHRLGPLLERAHDLIRHSERLAGWSPAGALPGLRRLLRAMNSYYSNKIEGQHTLPLEIEQALRNDYAQDSDLARRQRLALAHMDTEAWLEQAWTRWSSADAWAPHTVAAIHQELFTRLPPQDLSAVWPKTNPCAPASGAPARSVWAGMPPRPQRRCPRFWRAGPRCMAVSGAANCNWWRWRRGTIGWRGFTRFAMATGGWPACIRTRCSASWG